MKKDTKPLAPLAPIAAALFLAALAVAPLSAQDPVRSIRISVADARTGHELAVVSPNEEITLFPGEEVVLRLFEPNPSRRVERRALPATFGFGPTQTPIQIVSSATDRGEATIRLNDTAAGERWHVGYKLSDRVALADAGLQLGRILVRVGGPGTTSVTGAQRSPSGPGQWGTPADAVVNALYRGILLRDPDPGSAGGRDDIARHGLEGIRRVAGNIARSPESRGLLYDRNVTNSQRLDAIYENLLGWSRGDVGRDRWTSDLAELDRGNLAGVVDAIVRSEQFRSRFGF